MRKERLRWIIGALVAICVGIQFIPVNRSNPPMRSELPASADVVTTLRASCFDCHSNETVWPWYSYVAPASWLIARDVKEGRRHVNFSEWASLSAEDEADAREEITEVLNEGEMPLWYYLPLHRGAELTDAERDLLVRWAASR